MTRTDREPTGGITCPPPSWTETSRSRRPPSPPLALADRCDAPAVVSVLPSDNDLVFCAHHGREHEAALAAAGATVRDESGTITT